MLVQSVRRPPAKEDEDKRERSKRKRLKEEALLASSVAARELRAVVKLASRRGLNAEEIFLHFVAEDVDVARTREEGKGELGCRCVGKKEVVKGMAGLGISLSEDAAALLIETIVRSSAERSPRRRKNLAAADKHASLFKGNLRKSRRVLKGSADATTAGAADRVAKRGRQAHLKRSAPGPKILSSLPRQHITAEDLWNFALRDKAQDTRSRSGSEETNSPAGRGDGGAGNGESEGVHALSPDKQEQATNEDVDGGTGPSSKRRRTQNGENSWRVRSAKGKTGQGTSPKDGVHSMGRAHRLSPLPASPPLDVGGGNSDQNSVDLQQTWGSNLHASRSTLSPSSAAGGAAATATASYAASPELSGREAIAAKGRTRPRSMRAHLDSINSRGTGDSKESSGSRLDPARGETTPTYGSLAAVGATQDHTPVPGVAPRDSHDNAEVASFPCESPTVEAKDGKDRVFHVKRCVQEFGYTFVMWDEFPVPYIPGCMLPH